MRIPLSIATGDYDITRPLLDGAVAVDGVDLIPLALPSPPRHWRMSVNGEFDVAEMSLGSYVARVSRGRDDLVGIPAFPHRRFRHGYVFLPGASAVSRPAELAGGSIGVRNWQTTAGVWLRGILAEHGDLPTESVRWVAQDGEDIALDLPDAVRLSLVAEGERVTDLCARGEVDALIYPEIPEQVRDGSGLLRRLYPDPKAAEQDYYRATGIFPIMHLVVLRAELAERYPWLPRTLLDAFQRAKEAAWRRLRDPRTVSLAWLRALQEEEAALLGPDPWEYGLGPANRHTLATFLAYAHAQGVAARALEVDELFHPATTHDLPRYI